MSSEAPSHSDQFRTTLKVAYESVFRALEGRAADAEHGESLNRREAYYFKLLAELGVLESGRELVDLGAGMSWFGPIATALGLQVRVIDDYGGGGGVDIHLGNEDGAPLPPGDAPMHIYI